MLYVESSERSEKSNLVKKKISSFSSIQQFSFEGYTTLKGKTSLLLDRLFASDDEHLLSDQMVQKIISIEPFYIEKIDFANRLDINWIYVVYKKNEHIVVFDMKTSKLIKKFTSFNDLGDFISQYSDKYTNLSPYHESDLPTIDIKMRAIGKSWPGNLDSVIYKARNLLTIIEYQNTSRTVDTHDNNFFMIKRNGRKDDRGRWTVIDILKRKLISKLFVIVWSKSDDRIHIKEIINMKYEGNYVSRIIWGKDLLIKLDDLTEEIFVSFLVND